jgi:hypothetical protein
MEFLTAGIKKGGQSLRRHGKPRYPLILGMTEKPTARPIKFKPVWYEKFEASKGGGGGGGNRKAEVKVA